MSRGLGDVYKRQDSIIFDMDQVGTRDHALDLLAEAIHQQAY